MVYANARFSRWALLAVVALTVLFPLAVLAAPPDDTAIAAAEKLEDQGKPRKPPVFTPDRRNPDVEALKAEVQRLRAQAEMCRAESDRKAAALTASGGALMKQ